MKIIEVFSNPTPIIEKISKPVNTILITIFAESQIIQIAISKR